MNRSDFDDYRGVRVDRGHVFAPQQRELSLEMGVVSEWSLAGRLLVPLLLLLLRSQDAHEGTLADSVVLYRIGTQFHVWSLM